MATARDVYNKAIALIDEISSETGTVDVATTGDYESRAPYLIDILQKEVARIGKYKKVADIAVTATTADPSIAYATVTMPTDVDYIEKAVVLDPPDNYYRQATMVENKNVYVPTTFDGTIRLTYFAVPADITTLEDTLVVDHLSQVAMSYGLAKAFVLPEGNSEMTSYLTREYDEKKALISRIKPASFEQVFNAYGGF